MRWLLKGMSAPPNIAVVVTYNLPPPYGIIFFTGFAIMRSIAVQSASHTQGSFPVLSSLAWMWQPPGIVAVAKTSCWYASRVGDTLDRFHRIDLTESPKTGSCSSRLTPRKSIILLVTIIEIHCSAIFKSMPCRYSTMKTTFLVRVKRRIWYMRLLSVCVRSVYPWNSNVT